MLVVTGILPGIQSLRTRHQLKLHNHVVLRLQTGSVGSLLKRLLNHQIFNKVEVDFVRNPHRYFLHKHGGIALRHINATHKTKGTVVAGKETQLYAPDAIDRNRIRQIIFVEARSDA